MMHTQMSVERDSGLERAGIVSYVRHGFHLSDTITELVCAAVISSAVVEYRVALRSFCTTETQQCNLNFHGVVHAGTCSFISLAYNAIVYSFLINF